MLHLFRLMPEYLGYGDLGCWDGACADVLRDESTPTHEVIWALFDLGRTNLYAAYNAAYTQDAWAYVVTQFSVLRLPVPPLSPGALDAW